MTGVRLPEINISILSGRVTRDAEIFVTQSGMTKVTIRIAVNRRVKDAKTGEWKDDTFFIDCVAWRELAERSKDKAKKGVACVVEGRLSAREYEAKDGQKKSIFEVQANRIQFLTAGGDAGSAGAAPAKSASAGGASSDESLEEVPF